MPKFLESNRNRNNLLRTYKEKVYKRGHAKKINKKYHDIVGQLYKSRLINGIFYEINSSNTYKQVLYQVVQLST